MGPVQQEVFLFDTTVYDNAAYADVDAPRERAIRGLDVARRHEHERDRSAEHADNLLNPSGYNYSVVSFPLESAGAPLIGVDIPRVSLAGAPIS